MSKVAEWLQLARSHLVKKTRQKLDETRDSNRMKIYLKAGSSTQKMRTNFDHLLAEEQRKQFWRSQCIKQTHRTQTHQTTITVCEFNSHIQPAELQHCSPKHCSPKRVSWLDDNSLGKPFEIKSASPDKLASHKLIK